MENNQSMSETAREAIVEKMAQIMCDQELRSCMKFSLEQIYEERERTWRRHIKEASDLLEAFERNGLSLVQSHLLTPEPLVKVGGE